MTEEEFDFFCERMEAAKQKSQADFFIAVLRKRKIIVVEDLRSTLVELKRHGNNLNQIARQLNEGAEIRETAWLVMDECWKTYQALLALSEGVK